MQWCDHHGTSLAARFSVLVRLKNLWRLATKPLRERGIAETVRSVRVCFSARERERRAPFDGPRGVDTEQRIRLTDLDAIGSDVQALWHYWPTSEKSFHDVMHDAAVREGEQVFIDLGSGKGRAVLMASEYPFARVVGVELSPALHEIAQRNVRQWRSSSQRCFDIELLCADVRDFAFPPEKMLVYLFQPFPKEVLEVVIEHLAQSLRECPRAVTVAYLNPIFHEQILRSGCLELERWGHPDNADEFAWAIYRTRA